MISAVIFDFDGVIAESVDVKTQAFRELFKGHPDILDEVEKFHLENGGMSRYDKFRHIYANILKLELTEEKFRELCEAFQRLVVDKVVASPFVAGAKETLKYFFEKYPMYVVSGTPQEEIREIIKRRALTKYFLQVYGSPESKTLLIKRILRDNKYKPEEVLFVGDSKNDLKAAVEAGVMFIARVADPDKDWFRSKDVKKYFSDLNGLKEYIESQNKESR